MIRIDVAFLVLAAVCLIVGVLMGIGMGIAHDFQFAPMHAHLNLVGWVSLALFGLAYKSYPTLARSRLAVVHLVTSAVGGIMFPLGLYFAIAHQAIGLSVTGAFLWLAGAVLFLMNLLRSLVFAPGGVRQPVGALARS